MGLLKKIKEKFCKKHFISIDFKNFCTENDRIRKTAVEIAKILMKDDIQRFLSPCLKDYQLDLMDFADDLQEKFQKQTGNKSYAVSMAQLVRFQKVYCLYYMNAEDGKTDKQRQKMYDNLFQIRDLIVFNLLKHMIYIKGKNFIWTGDEFFSLDQLAEDEIGTVKTACELMDINGKLIDSMKFSNNLGVYEVLNQLTFENFNQDVSVVPFQL